MPENAGCHCDADRSGGISVSGRFIQPEGV